MSVRYSTRTSRLLASRGRYPVFFLGRGDDFPPQACALPAGAVRWEKGCILSNEGCESFCSWRHWSWTVCAWCRGFSTQSRWAANMLQAAHGKTARCILNAFANWTGKLSGRDHSGCISPEGLGEACISACMGCIVRSSQSRWSSCTMLPTKSC